MGWVPRGPGTGPVSRSLVQGACAPSRPATRGTRRPAGGDPCLYPRPGYVGVDGGLRLLECGAAAGHTAHVLAGVLRTPVGDAAVAQVDIVAGPAPDQVPQVPGLGGLAARHRPYGHARMG